MEALGQAGPERYVVKRAVTTSATSYFALKNALAVAGGPDGSGLTVAGRLVVVLDPCGETGTPRAHSACCLASSRPLILTRLWAKTPCPHQILTPSMPSMRVRSQP